MSRLILTAAFLTAIAMRSAAGQSLPTNCTFPLAIDQLVSVNPGDQLTSAMFNQMRCLLNRLQTRSLEAGQSEVACAAVTLAAGGRSQALLVLPSTVPATAAVQVTARDNGSPGMLTAEVEAPIDTTVPVWVWNHDADAIRDGVVCVHVVRP